MRTNYSDKPVQVRPQEKKIEPPVTPAPKRVREPKVQEEVKAEVIE